MPNFDAYDSVFKTIITFFLACAVIMLIVFFSISPGKPQVIVNLPADYKPLAELPKDTKVLTNEKAILWWSVYSKSVDNGRRFPQDDANQAIKAVYGN